jgi:indolepyruvate ferredoxin oxidoreductase alpha subunit
LDFSVAKKLSLSLDRTPYRFVPYPGNAVAMHRKQHERLVDFERDLNRKDWDEIHGSGILGVIATGFCFSKLLDVIPDPLPEIFRILKLSSLYPLPQKTIAEFLEGCKEIIVLEESDAFIETQLKALAYDLGSNAKINGKLSGHLPHGDELLRWQIQELLENFIPEFIPKQIYLKSDQAREHPSKVNHCADSPNEHILTLLQEVAKELGQNPILISDPGCWVKVAGELDGKFAIGSSVAVASGMLQSGVDEPVVALFGDSAFFHSAISAICNAAANNSNIFILILDNSGALSTGRQPTPATGVDVIGNPTTILSIVDIAKACGVEKVDHLPAGSEDDVIKAKLRSGLVESSFALLMLEI